MARPSTPCSTSSTAIACRPSSSKRTTAVARRAQERGRQVVLISFADGDPDLGGIERARAIIANGQDDENAAVIVSARLQGFKGPIYAFVEKPSHRRPMVLAGATAAYTPRHILAAALAAKASERIAPRVAGLRHLGEHLQITELRIQPSSELAGKTLRDANIRARTGSTVLGHWGRKAFVALPHADLVVEAGAILLAVGSAEAVRKLGELATPLRREGAIFVCGYGEVGVKVTEMLRDAGEAVVVIERRDLPGVDVVGDALDPDTLRRAAIHEAKAVVLALDSGPTLFATSVVRDLAPDVPIIARVNHADNVTHVRHAGADFAMSISEVAAQIVAQQLLGEHSVSLESDVKLTQVTAAGLAGKSPAHAGVAERTGCAIVAVERGDQVVVDFAHDFHIDEGDTLYICGSRQAVADYLDAFPQPKG